MNGSPDDNDFDIDSLLMKRAAPRAPHDLPERILYRAARTPQTVRMTMRGIFDELLSFIAVPRPVLTFGLCLMIGMFSGWSVSRDAEAGDGVDDTAQAVNMLVIEEEWL